MVARRRNKYYALAQEAVSTPGYKGPYAKPIEPSKEELKREFGNEFYVVGNVEKIDSNIFDDLEERFGVDIHVKNCETLEELKRELDKRYKHLLENKLGPTVDYKNAYGTMPWVLQFGRLYKESTEGTTIVLKEIEGNKIMKIPTITRFSRGYYNGVIEKILRLAKFPEYQRGLMLTLTADPKRYRTPKEVKDAIIKEWNRIRTWAKRKKNKDLIKDWTGEYIAVPEIQPNNTKLVHYHIVLFGATWADVGRIREQWERWMGKGTFFHVDKLYQEFYVDEKTGQTRRTNAILYVLKYIVKASDMEDNTAMLWALSTRAFNVSRGLLGDLAIFIHGANNSNKRWVLIGTFIAANVENISTYAELVAAYPILNELYPEFRPKKPPENP